MRVAPIVLALTVLASSAAARAQSTPAPKPDFAPFAFLIGTWSCRATKDPDAAVVGKTFPFEVAADPGGYWYIVTTPHTKRYLSYDAATASWVTTALTSQGGSYSDRSAGWSGNAAVFKDAFASDGSPLGSTTLTKLGVAEFTLHSVQPGASGASVSDIDCTKP